MSARSYMARAEKFCKDSLSRCIRNGHLSANWINDGSRWFWYSSEDAEGKNWYLADTKTGKKKQLFDTADFFSKLNESGVKKTAEDFYLSEPEFNETATEFSFDCDKRRFLYNIRKGSLQEIPTKEKRAKHFEHGDYRKRYSADSLFYASASGDNLAIYSTSGEIVQSFDGEHYHSFATGGNRPRRKENIEECAGCPIGGWIGKSHSYLAIREDLRDVETLTLVDNLSEPRPVAKTYKFAMPADKNVASYEVFLADADKGRLERLDVERFADQSFILPRFRNFQTSDSSAFLLRIARTRDTLDLVRIDAESHKVTTIISEVCKPHLPEK